MLLDQASFVVVDVETTGGQAAACRVTEIAAVKVQGGAVTERWSTLVNPRQTIPPRITRITGISTGMVLDAPPFEEVAGDFLKLLGQGVFVAQNLPFDRGFVQAELKRVGRLPFPNETLCTLRLARRLLPGLKSKGLSSLIQHYGIQVENGRHRALGDAEATAEILLRFLSQLRYEHDVETLEDVLRYQYKTYARSSTKHSRRQADPAHVRRIRREVLPQVPDRPGVYFMKDAREGILYVGKAKRLSERVRTYFTAVAAHDAHLSKLVKSVRSVAWEETGSELAALLLESKLIKGFKPPFNRAQRRYRARPFLRLDTASSFPTLTWTSILRDDGAEYFGPVGGKRTAASIVRLVDRFFRLRPCSDDVLAHGEPCLYHQMDRCAAPCTGGDAEAAYAEEVDRVRAFLRGEDTTGVLERIEAAMREAAQAMHFEEAAELRDGMRRLQRLLDKQRQIAAPVLDHHACIVQPGVEAGTAQLFLVRHGRLADTVDVRAPMTPDDLATLRPHLATVFDPSTPRPERYLHTEVDEVRVLSQWLYTQREQARSVPHQPDFDAFAEAVAAEVAALAQDSHRAAA